MIPKDIWNDPVGSKLIFNAVWAAVSRIWVYCSRIIADQRRKNEPILVDPSGNDLRPSKPGRRVFAWRLVTPIAISLVIFIWFIWRPNKQLQQRAAVGRFLVLVGDFDGAESPSLRVTDAIQDQVQTALRDHPNLEVRRLNARIPLNNDHLATQHATKEGASLILWGLHSRTHVKIKFRLLFEPVKNLFFRKEDSIVMSLASVESFEVNTPLRKQMTLLGVITTGLAKVASMDTMGAIAVYTNALRSPTLKMGDAERSMVLVARSGVSARDDVRDYLGTIADCTEALSLNSRADLAYQLRGIAYNKIGRPDMAVHDYTELLKFDSSSLEAYNNRAVSYARLGDYDSALRDLDSVLRLSPTDPRGFLNRGVTYLRKRDFDSAVRDFTKCLGQNPHPTVMALALMARGALYATTGKLDSALEDANAGLRIIPDHPFALAVRGSVYAQQGHFNEALVDLNRSLELDPGENNAYSDRARILLERGEPRKALIDATAYVRHHPKSASGYANRSLVYQALNDLDHALADANRALQLDHQYVPAMISMAVLHTKRGDLSRAADWSSAIIQRDPNNWTAYNNRCDAYAHLGQIARAIADCEKALTLQTSIVVKTDLALIYDSRGFAFGRRGEYSRALADFDRALQIDPTLGPSYLHRASLYRRMGRLQQAIVDYRKVLEVSGNRWKAEREQAMQALASISPSQKN